MSKVREIDRHASAADVLNMTQGSAKRPQHETADEYARVVVRLNADWRVIVCPDRLQWIVQKRTGGRAERPWRGVRYFQTREALVRFCATSCGLADALALDILAALPERIGGAA